MYKRQLEIVERREFPLNHPVEKQQGVWIITLQADQTFLDCLYEYPPNLPFQASVLRNLYIRGGTRWNPKDPKAQQPPGRTQLGKKALQKFLKGTANDVMDQTKEDDELTSKLSKLGKVR